MSLRTPSPYNDQIDDYARKLIRKAAKEACGQPDETARLLGISRNCLYRECRRLSITRELEEARARATVANGRAQAGA